ncbi:MAG: prephenate dehydrogenase/arogenate dehydrogenase family protein [Actinomycetota bacterium]|nr:prephenate dehydrogenase/arogenate dehydrogenase family protein [Actinomycetota bacterium]
MAGQEDTIGVVGLGLMGGSLLRRLSASGAATAGWDADPATCAAALAAGLTVPASLGDLVSGSGTVFVAVPLPRLGEVLDDLSAAGRPGLVVSDLTSVKEPVRSLAAGRDFAFVGGHPMAGTAESGFAASDADLLAGCPWVLTLDEETDVDAWLAVATIVTGLGARVVPVTSFDHDAVVARVSHLPHLLAAVLVAGVADDPLARTLAAGSFRDGTRVAATRAELTAAMCSGNADAIDAELAKALNRMDSARRLLRRPEKLTEWFAAAQQTRQGWPAATTSGPQRVELKLPADDDLREQLLAAGSAGGHVTRVAPGSVFVSLPAPAAS